MTQAMTVRGTNEAEAAATAYSDESAEGVLCVIHQAMDAYDRESIEELVRTIDETWGLPIEEATCEPDGEAIHRGGPFILGHLYRRAWTIDWSKVASEAHDHQDKKDLQKLAALSCELILQWAEYLPFVVAVLRVRDEDVVHFFNNVCEALFESLPGRLNRHNQLPFVTTQTLVFTKMTPARLESIRKAAENKSIEPEALRLLEEAVDLPRESLPRARVKNPYPNVLIIEGSGSRYVGEGFPTNSLRAFAFSSGNLYRKGDQLWNLPFWIGSGERLLAHQFNFHPFMVASIRHAQHVAIEAGKLDEELDFIARKIAAHRPPSHKARSTVDLQNAQQKLSLLQSKLLQIQIALHQGSKRSRVLPPNEDHKATEIEHEFIEGDRWPPRANWAHASTTEQLMEIKEESERESSSIVASLVDRTGALLGLATTIQARETTRSMLKLTKAMALLAALSLLTVVISLANNFLH